MDGARQLLKHNSFADLDLLGRSVEASLEMAASTDIQPPDALTLGLSLFGTLAELLRASADGSDLETFDLQEKVLISIHLCWWMFVGESDASIAVEVPESLQRE